MPEEHSTCQMPEETVICHRCGNVFKLTAANYKMEGDNIICPACGGGDTRVMPSWQPMGSDAANMPTKWVYECQACKHKFELPIPASPTVEKQIRCPKCNHDHIHRLTSCGYQPLYCG